MDDSKYSWWLELQHGGMIISPAVLKELIPEGFEQPPQRSCNALRDQYLKFKSATENPLKSRKTANPNYQWLDSLFENFLELSSALWKKEVNISPDYSYKNIIGENIKPNRLFFRFATDVRPALALFIDENPKLGMGKSRKRYGKILEYLRNKKIRLALFTNGFQLRLCYVGLDHDSWVEWNISNWFEGTEFQSQQYGFYTLLGKSGFYKTDSTAFPLYDAIESSRTRQGELSAILGEQVRESLEVLLRDFGKTKKKHPDLTYVVRLNPDGTSISEEAELSAIFQASVRVVMRLVVVLFAEARHLLPRSNEIYHSNYGIEGLFEQLVKAKSHATSDYMEMNTSAWYRLLSLFRLIYQGSPLSNLQVREYRGQLFEPGDVASFDPVKRALTLFEDPNFELTNASVYNILKRLKFGKVKIKYGRSVKFVTGPVDFRELRTEYIGMIYEGILDYELKSASEPMLLINTGIQPILPLSVLEALSETQIKDLFDKMKDSKSIAIADEIEEEAEDIEVEILEEEIIEEVEESVEDDDTKKQSELSERIQAWAEKAAVAMKWVKKPKRDADDYLFKTALRQKAKTIYKEFFESGDYYISRWGGTRKGSGTFYTRPQLAVPTVIRTLEPLCYTPEKPDITIVSSGETANLVQERLEQYETKHLYPRKPEEILDLKICDPACGSGSFLVSATNYITESLFSSLVIYADLLNPATFVRKTLPFGKLQDSPDFSDNLPCEPDDELFEPRVKAKLKRYVVENCIYGVDLNPTAVELAKLSLWIETMDKDLPFEFLDHKIKTGNSLVGAWLDTFHEYPIAAWQREGGDKSHSNGVTYEKEGWTKAIKKRFDQAIKSKMVELINIRIGQRTLAFDRDIQDVETIHNDLLQKYNQLHTADVSIFGLQEKQRHYEELLKSESYLRIRQRMDAWCALWFWPGDKIIDAPDPVEFYNLTEAQQNIVNAISAQQRFFHWEIEFPDVFNNSRSGFNAVIGNPPWEISKPNSKEFFSNLDPIYRTYGKQEALLHQKRLFESNNIIEYNWLLYNSYFKGMSNFIKHSAFPFGDPDGNDKNSISLARGNNNVHLHNNWRSKRKHSCFATQDHPYRLQGSADLNTYKMFLEYFLLLKCKDGRIGIILPSSVHRDDGTFELRKQFIPYLELLVKFDNEKLIFQGLEHNSKFDILIIGASSKETFKGAFFSWEDATVLNDIDDVIVEIGKNDIRKISPLTLSIPDLPTVMDINIVNKLYDNGEIIDNKIIVFREFDLTNDSKYFIKKGMLPVYQGCMIWQFNYRYNYYESESRKFKRGKLETTEFRPNYPLIPRYWVNVDSYIKKFPERKLSDHFHFEFFRIAYRIQSSISNQRTFINSVIPKNCSAGNSIGLFVLQDPTDLILYSTLLSSMVNDYNVRTKISSNINSFYIPQLVLPLINLQSEEIKFIIKNGLKLIATTDHLSELWNTIVISNNLDLPNEWSGDIPVTDHAERLKIQAEIDALCFNLFDLNINEVTHILNTFKSLDKRVPPEFKYQNLVQLAFNDLISLGSESFITNGSPELVKRIEEFKKSEYFTVIKKKTEYNTPLSKEEGFVNEPLPIYVNKTIAPPKKSDDQLNLFE